MRLARVLAGVAAAPLALLPLALAPTAATAAAPSPATYLALGDSLPAGVGAAPDGPGYVPLLAAELAARPCGVGEALGCRLELDNRAQSGATTRSLIAEQLPGAVALLQQRNGNATPVDDVRLITVTVGGNDVFGPVVAACAGGFAAPTCQPTVATQLGQVSAGYATMLGQLRSAAGPSTTIAVTTYYNPLPACPLAHLAPLADVVLEGGGPLSAGLNDVIRQRAAAYGAVVVETGPVVDLTEVRPDCLHPNAKGHADIAAAFAAAVGESVVGGPGRQA